MGDTELESVTSTMSTDLGRDAHHGKHRFFADKTPYSTADEGYQKARLFAMVDSVSR